MAAVGTRLAVRGPVRRSQIARSALDSASDGCTLVVTTLKSPVPSGGGRGRGEGGSDAWRNERESDSMVWRDGGGGGDRRAGVCGPNRLGEREGPHRTRSEGGQVERVRRFRPRRRRGRRRVEGHVVQVRRLERAARDHPAE